MAKTRSEVTCDDCFFGRHGLCALQGNVTCPTFRAAKAGMLEPPRHPQLVPRPLPRVVVVQAA
jgi:hypothetical protein